MADTEGRARSSTVRDLARLAVPTLGQLIAEPTFILIDTAIIGHVGTSALAGLSLGSTVILTAVGLCVFLAYATTSQVAHLLGAGRRRVGLQTGIDSLWLALAIGVVLAAALFAFAEPICFALGVTILRRPSPTRAPSCSARRACSSCTRPTASSVDCRR